MDVKTTEDEKAWGPHRWVYCGSHLYVHATGWCTVPVENKVLLKSKDRKDADAEARARGLNVK